ncbi:MAG: hypothetical protein R2838_08115 [Caldilineaceae bacterium]
MTESASAMFAPENLTDQERFRLNNLQALRDAGIDPLSGARQAQPRHRRRPRSTKRARLLTSRSPWPDG